MDVVHLRSDSGRANITGLLTKLVASHARNDLSPPPTPLRSLPGRNGQSVLQWLGCPELTLRTS